VSSDLGTAVRTGLVPFLLRVPRLILNPGQSDEQTFPLRGGANTIGRTPENDVCVVHRSLSRRHARIDVEDGRLAIEDLQSKNGTFVDGERITRRPLRHRATFVCGEVPFQVLLDSDGHEVTEDQSQPTLVLDMQSVLAAGSIDELLEPAVAAGQPALKVRRGREEARAQDKMRVLLRASEILASPGSIDSLLERILQLLFQILEIDRGAVLLREPDDTLRPRIARTAAGQSLDLPIFSEHIVQYVREHRKAALFLDARDDSRLDTAASVMSQSIRSSMCVPLVSKGGLIGVLYVDNLTTPDRFQQEDLEFLAAFANQAAVAIENATLAKQIEQDAVLRSHYLRFFSPSIASKLQGSSGGALELQEADATVLFADLSQYTALSSRLKPVEIMALLNEYFPVATEAVFRHDGTLEKYIGDALLAVWGAPIPHPDDVDRAIRAAVEIHQAVVRLNERFRAQGRPEIHVHQGINFGRVAAGNVGSAQYLQYATIGDATNVASRVCSLANADELLITEAVLEHWKDRRWPVEKLPAVTVKGKQEELVVYRVDWKAGFRL
jgi:adenylate cyclase